MGSRDSKSKGPEHGVGLSHASQGKAAHVDVRTGWWALGLWRH